MNIIILCGPDGSGKKGVVDSVKKVLSRVEFGKNVHVNKAHIYVVSSKDGVKIGLAKKITESDINSLMADSRGIEVLVCSTRTDKDAWRYCDLIREVSGGYAILLKRKEQQQDREWIEALLCRQILSCINSFTGK